MEVRLLTRWGSRFQGDVVSVSDERAKALAEAGIGKILNPVAKDVPAEAQEQTSDAPAEDGGSHVDELEAVKAQLDALGVSYSPRIGLDKARAKLEEALDAK